MTTQEAKWFDVLVVFHNSILYHDLFNKHYGLNLKDPKWE